ncbi:PspC domain-containing protein [Liberiplasma polymorphum]|uniref:PspC domain-containing protein n=1 Tax=Liberiplasma polymorphum TaxID=3374570 RepID=UPI003773874A
MQNKVLYRDDKNMMIAGVCSGLAEYTDMDASLVRVLTFLLAVFTGGGVVIAYIVMALIIPSKSVLVAQGKVKPNSKYRNNDKNDDFTIDPDDYKL